MELYLWLYITVAILAILAFTPKIRKYLSAYWILRKLPSIKYTFLIRCAVSFIGLNFEDYLDNALHFSKDIYSPRKFFFGPIPYVVFSKPEDMKTIGTAMGCVNKSYHYNFIRLPRSIVAIPADLWKPKRRLITSSFSVQALKKTFLPIFNDNVKKMTSNLEMHAQRYDRDFLKFIKYCLLENVCETTFGYKIGVQSGKNLHFIEAIDNIERIVTKRLFQIWFHLDVIYKWCKLYQEECKCFEIVQKLSNKIIDLKKKEYLEAPENDEKSQVLINRFVKHLFDGNFSHEDVLDDVQGIIIAGYETCAQTLSHIILMLAMHQDVQEKVLEEVRTVNLTPDAPMSFEDAEKLSYTELVIKETLRLFPVAPFLGRTCSKDVTLSNGVVPEGTRMLLLICHMHRNESIWGSKYNDFYPEHFLPENVAKRHPYSYAPFGVGLRDCIAIKYAFISMKIILSGFLKKFKVNINGVTMTDLKLSMEFAMQVKQTQDIRIAKRYISEF